MVGSRQQLGKWCDDVNWETVFDCGKMAQDVGMV